MKERKLKEIFELMFKKMESISVDNNFIDEINKRRKRIFDKNKSDPFFYEKLVHTIHVSGYKVSIVRNRWEDIKKAFSNFDINKVSQYTHENLKKMMSNPKLIRNQRKLKACIANAKIMREISTNHGSFGEYLDKHKDNPQKLKEELITRFHYLGNILVLDYLKDVGIDAIKPDVHVARVMHRLGFINSERMTPENIDKVIEVASSMSRAVKEKLSIIDGIFWLYGGGENKYVKKAICSKRSPLCNECPLRKYCTFYLEVVRGQ